MKPLLIVLLVAAFLEIGVIILQQGKEIITRQNCKSDYGYMQVLPKDSLAYKTSQDRFVENSCSMILNQK